MESERKKKTEGIQKQEGTVKPERTEGREVMERHLLSSSKSLLVMAVSLAILLYCVAILKVNPGVSLILSALMDTCCARWPLVIHAENFPHWKGASYVSSKRLA